MNKKAVAFLLPLYFVALLFLIIVLFANTMSPDMDTPRLGEVPTHVYDAYAQKHSAEMYATHAMRIALLEAATKDAGEEFISEAKRLYTRQLREHPTLPLLGTVSSQREHNTYTFTLSNNVRIPMEYGTLPAQRTLVSTGGALRVWPLAEDSPGDAYLISSVFGKRDVDRGSSSHAGIDLPAPLETPVLAVETGEVVYVNTQNNHLYLRTVAGYTCGYYHVQPLVTQGEVVEAGAVVAQITDDGYGYHLDLRCYDHEATMTQQDAIELFGQEHVRISSDPPDSAYVIFTNNFEGINPYVDPLCLFGESHQQAVREAYANNQEYVESVSGLQAERRRGDSIDEKLSDTCQAYEQAQIITSRPGELTDAFIESVLDEIIALEGTTIVDEPERNGQPEWSKYGITNRAYESYFGVSDSTRQDIDNLDEQTARQIYASDYIFTPRFNELPLELAMGVIDAGVNQGVPWTNQALREMLVDVGVLDSTSVGMDEVIQAAYLAQASGINLADKWADVRMQRYDTLMATGRYSDNVYLSWSRRAEKYRSPGQVTEVTGVAALRGSGGYQFSLKASYELPAEVAQSLRIRENMKTQLRVTHVLDYERIASIIHPQEYQQKTSYQEQVQNTIQQCQLQLEDGCSCFVKLPAQESMTMNASHMRLGDEVFETSWVFTREDDDITYELSALVIEEEENEETGEIQETLVQETIPLATHPLGSNEMQYQDALLFETEQVLYLQASQQDSHVSVTISQNAQTPVCEQTVLEGYEHIDSEDRFTVKHPIR